MIGRTIFQYQIHEKLGERVVSPNLTLVEPRWGEIPPQSALALIGTAEAVGARE